MLPSLDKYPISDYIKSVRNRILVFEEVREQKWIIP